MAWIRALNQCQLLGIKGKLWQKGKFGLGVGRSEGKLKKKEELVPRTLS